MGVSNCAMCVMTTDFLVYNDSMLGSQPCNHSISNDGASIVAEADEIPGSYP